MRFMMLMYPNVPDEGWTPSSEAMGSMGKYNDELSKAGVLLALDGLHPAAKGARVSWPDGKATIHDGPFSEAKEVVGGYWVIQVRSRDEAVEWAKRIPDVSDGQVVEVRQIQEMEDFPAEIQEAARQAQA